MPVTTEPCEQDAEQHASVSNPAMPTHAKESWRLDASLLSALFVLSFCYLCIFRSVTTIEPDEGILLQGAERILSGQVLYRDFFSFYTPGSYYALAMLFRVFGDSIVVARTALALTGAILSILTYVLARRVCSRRTSLTIAALTTATTLPYRFLVLHNWDSTLWAFLALYCAVRILEGADWRWAFALGTFASLTVMFEQSKGMGVCLGLSAGFTAIFLLQGRRPLLSRVQLLALGSGVAWPLLITFIYFASHHTTSVMLADWLWPLQHYSTANRVPYGYQNWSDESRNLLFTIGTLLERQIKLLAISPCFWIPVLPRVVHLLDNPGRPAACSRARISILHNCKRDVHWPATEYHRSKSRYRTFDVSSASELSCAWLATGRTGFPPSSASTCASPHSNLYRDCTAGIRSGAAVRSAHGA
jgi:4-amino-4-deoxy-L-arabinose transferase-like glycosyltransferase